MAVIRGPEHWRLVPTPETSPYMPSTSHRRLRPAALTIGFTLLDALLGMSIAVIVFGIALPNYRDAVAQVHASAARTAMTMSLFGAMRDATVNGQEAVMCPSSDEIGCLDGTDWSQGWIVFIDLNGDRSRSPNETLTGRQPELSGDVRLHSTQGRPRIVFQPNGSNAGSNATFTLCDRRGPKEAVRLVLSNSGRLRALPARADAALGCTAAWR
jgi:type IV fimbrial biogenesis protein FimT